MCATAAPLRARRERGQLGRERGQLAARWPSDHLDTAPYGLQAVPVYADNDVQEDAAVVGKSKLEVHKAVLHWATDSPVNAMSKHMDEAATALHASGDVSVHPPPSPPLRPRADVSSHLLALLSVPAPRYTTPTLFCTSSSRKTSPAAPCSAPPPPTATPLPRL